MKIRPDHHSGNVKCHLKCKSLIQHALFLKHLITIRDTIVSMPSTIPDSYRRKADIHLKLSMQPYHLSPRSPLLIRNQMNDQHVGKWKDSDWQQLPVEIFKLLGKKIITSLPYLEIIQHNERMLRSMVWKISCLLIHHLAAEFKQDVIFLTFRVMNQTTSFCSYLWCFLHRLYFTLKKKAPAMSVTVSPCDLPIEWSLSARTLKDKPLKSLQCEWTVRPQPAPSDTHLTLKIITASG